MKFSGLIFLNCIVKLGAILWITASDLGNYDSLGATPFSISIQLETRAPGTVVYTLISGALPTGMTLGSGGLLSGSMSSIGTYTFTIRAGVGAITADRTFTMVLSNSAGGDIGN